MMRPRVAELCCAGWPVGPLPPPRQVRGTLLGSASKLAYSMASTLNSVYSKASIGGIYQMARSAVKTAAKRKISDGECAPPPHHVHHCMYGLYLLFTHQHAYICQPPHPQHGYPTKA